MKKLLILSIVAGILAVPNYTWAEAMGNNNTKAYYVFFESNLGANYKRLEHNILGFSIDIPSDWIFGITGKGHQTVVILYPNKLNTNLLSDDYETIEIGIIPLNLTALSEAYSYMLLGMEVTHNNLSIIDNMDNKKIEEREAVEGSFSWKSKNGSEIIEWVTLIKHKDQIRSIVVRTGKNNFPKKKAYYSKFIQTYKPFDLGF